MGHVLSPFYAPFHAQTTSTPISWAIFLHCWASSGKASRGTRYDGPDTLSAARQRPHESKTGTATPCSPSSNSPTAEAQPRSLTSSSCRSSSALLVIVREVSFGSTPARPSSPNASRTLPSEVQCNGVRLPTQFITPTTYRASTCATVAASLPCR